MVRSHLDEGGAKSDFSPTGADSLVFEQTRRTPNERVLLVCGRRGRVSNLLPTCKRWLDKQRQ